MTNLQLKMNRFLFFETKLSYDEAWKIATSLFKTGKDTFVYSVQKQSERSVRWFVYKPTQILKFSVNLEYEGETLLVSIVRYYGGGLEFIRSYKEIKALFMEEKLEEKNEINLNFPCDADTINLINNAALSQFLDTRNQFVPLLNNNEIPLTEEVKHSLFDNLRGPVELMFMSAIVILNRVEISEVKVMEIIFILERICKYEKGDEIPSLTNWLIHKFKSVHKRKG